MKGKFITLEGSEGCGKTTQVELLVEWLKTKGVSVLCLREPGGTPLGESIRHLLKHDPIGRGMCSETEMLLFNASRAELTRKVILPALEDGRWVLCDRFYDSTTVYQGYARGLDLKMVQAVNDLAVGSCRPDLTLVLDLDEAEAKRRLMRRPKPADASDRIEDEPDSFFEKVRQGYRELAKLEPHRIHLVSAEGTKQEVAGKIQQELRHAFSEIMG